MNARHLLLLALVLGGCTSTGQPLSVTSSLLPSFSCKGKAVLMLQGGALGNANGANSIDCGDGFVLQQLQPGPLKP